MRLDLFRSLWGYRGELRAACEAVRAAGLAGIETRLPLDPDGRAALAAQLADHGLDYIAACFTSGIVLPDQRATPARHLDDLDRLLAAAADLSPRFVNVLAGNDRWPLAAQVEFFGRALELATKHGQMCSFETHRARSLYSPWVTLDLIRQVPDLRFTSDISHWVVVCERLLDDAADDLAPFVSRVHHIQARVGYDQGPQVPHPAAPEYAAALAFHEAHWAAVWRSQAERGYPVTTMTPEFGPDGYLHHLPFTDAPIADLAQLNAWMVDAQRAHFARRFGA
ncbi:sugar phosphate isomerase/epimerase family protein [Paraburkholderia caballeronis]|uniref:Sugar phosphate isomerase/epimerase n=1 Tax=Paraburkholderia caballeronis TaxID=416943 RepID=A0A1H7NZC8_9BURK|nr:TIM barrel protein [Paraburkholderia caballeronis]PXW25463.1 sugar phosphate isomerase/epimerase [Paraburkholderia caballeronis]PXX01070.1 sugar phosphate isomerase/epimerase [Paraburkholderia caballeronis]RAJ99577.1 sugar phosphate isomerase/epimerase [Paraburkholderia caballeronis]SEE36398.1 Sugar phosphate isomerase/epimerase [Paraburkholderia caballeronis]SEL28736.1 Sugar phosphate isomerase/epimerase [Paraburkholderia caballeronis]